MYFEKPIGSAYLSGGWVWKRLSIGISIDQFNFSIDFLFFGIGIELPQRKKRREIDGRDGNEIA